MSAEAPQPKATRKRRRVPGTDTPPRASIVLRIEQRDPEQLTALLTNAKRSRNDFICGLITAELQHIERFRQLNPDPAARHYLERATHRRPSVPPRLICEVGNFFKKSDKWLC